MTYFFNLISYDIIQHKYSIIIEFFQDLYLNGENNFIEYYLICFLYFERVFLYESSHPPSSTISVI